MGQRMGQIKVIQAADVQYADGQIERRLNIRRMERAGLGRVLVHLQARVEDPLDVLHRPTDIQERAVGMRGSHGQALRPGESGERFVILFGWAELLRELLRAQIMTVPGTGRIVELIEKRGERLLIS